MKELRDKAEKFAFQAEVNRMMKLIINSLYRNKEVCALLVYIPVFLPPDFTIGLALLLLAVEVLFTYAWLAVEVLFVTRAWYKFMLYFM